MMKWIHMRRRTKAVPIFFQAKFRRCKKGGK